jgi:hypothetical protein
MSSTFKTQIERPTQLNIPRLTTCELGLSMVSKAPNAPKAADIPKGKVSVALKELEH